MTPEPTGPRWDTVHLALDCALRAAELTSLQLTAASPEIAVLVCAPETPRGSELELWPTRVPASDWHDELLLLAAAARVTPQRRRVVSDIGLVLSGLLTSEQRRVQAELLARRAIELAGTDTLTQLGNRRAWLRVLEEESARAARYRQHTSIAVIDLDGLKRINDEEGHASGDEHLRRAAQALRDSARSVDVVCRLGGDEFAVLAPETGADGAVRLAERLGRSLAAASIQASIGVAVSDRGSLEQAWHEADDEMYRRKRTRYEGTGDAPIVLGSRDGAAAGRTT